MTVEEFPQREISPLSSHPNNGGNSPKHALDSMTEECRHETCSRHRVRGFKKAIIYLFFTNEIVHHNLLSVRGSKLR